MSNLIDCIKGSLNCILGIRESIGADLRKVYIVTRTWSGTSIGDGEVSEEVEQITPTPGIYDLSNDHRVKEGGQVQAGDILIRQISKSSYPDKVNVDCTVDNNLKEKFYRLGTEDYRVINVVEKYVVWDVQVRKISDQRTVEELNNG